MNMSYCRFENTLNDLQDCAGALDENGMKSLSTDERRAAERMIDLCRDMAEAFAEEPA